MMDNDDKITITEYETRIKNDIDNKGFSFINGSFQKLEKKDSVGLIEKLRNDSAYILQGYSYDIKRDKDPDFGEVFFLYDKSKTDIIKVGGIIDYLSLTLEFESDTHNRYFRGQKAHHSLCPSLFRHNEWVRNEMEINARIYNERLDNFVDCNSTFDKLVKLKHYDQPSRLFDLTSNPLVALFFACFSSDETEAGVVFEAFAEKAQEKISVSSDTVVMLTAMTNTKIPDCAPTDKCRISCFGNPPTTKDGKTTKCSVRRDKDSCFYSCVGSTKKKEQGLWKSRLSEWERGYIGELQHQCKKEGMPIYWDDLCFQELDQCILVKPPLNTDRIIRQQGCFIMCGMNPVDVYKTPESLLHFFKGYQTNRQRIFYILPHDRKEIMKQLNALGFDEYYFFPEFEKKIKTVRDSYIK